MEQGQTGKGQDKYSARQIQGYASSRTDRYTVSDKWVFFFNRKHNVKKSATQTCGHRDKKKNNPIGTGTDHNRDRRVKRQAGT